MSRAPSSTPMIKRNRTGTTRANSVSVWPRRRAVYERALSVAGIPSPTSATEHRWFSLQNVRKRAKLCPVRRTTDVHRIVAVNAVQSPEPEPDKSVAINLFHRRHPFVWPGSGLRSRRGRPSRSEQPVGLGRGDADACGRIPRPLYRLDTDVQRHLSLRLGQQRPAKAGVSAGWAP